MRSSAYTRPKEKRFCSLLIKPIIAIQSLLLLSLMPVPLAERPTKPIFMDRKFPGERNQITGSVVIPSQRAVHRHLRWSSIGGSWAKRKEREKRTKGRTMKELNR